MSARLIAVLGGSQSGKSSVAQFFKQQVDSATTLEYSEEVIKVAREWGKVWPMPYQFPSHPDEQRSFIEPLLQPLAWILNGLAGTYPVVAKLKSGLGHGGPWFKLVHYCSRGLNPAEVTFENRDEHRGVLEWLGAYLVEQVRETIWDDMLEPRLQQALARHELVTVCIRFPSNAALTRQYDGLVVRVVRPTAKPSRNPTETRINEIKPDVVLHNDGNLHGLESIVAAIWSAYQSDLVSSHALTPVEYRVSQLAHI